MSYLNLAKRTIATIRQQAAEDADYLFLERAAILEYDAHLPRAEAERRARAELSKEGPDNEVHQPA